MIADVLKLCIRQFSCTPRICALTSKFAASVNPKPITSANDKILRHVSNNNLKGDIYSVQVNCVSDEVKRQFDSVFPDIVQELTDPVKHKPNLHDWYTKLLEYNIPNGRKRRGYTAILAYRLLEQPHNLTEENLRLSDIMGWCLELVNAGILITDDMLDSSEMRRDLLCWYKLEDIGLSAVMDAIIVENSANVLLYKYFRNHPCHMGMLDLFNDMNLKMCIGQALDYRITNVPLPNLAHITMDNFKTIAGYRGAPYTFSFPIQAAMYLAGLGDVELHRQVDAALLPIGYLAQVKNDFLDCFGSENKLHKERFGDIRMGKCSWLAAVAMNLVSPTQRAVMERCYGRADDQSVEAVMEVYRALDMPTIYANHTNEIISNFLSEVKQMDPRIPKKIFDNVLDMC